MKLLPEHETLVLPITDSSGLHVYFLLDDGEVVYIGQSKRVDNRIKQHRLRLTFDSALSFRVNNHAELYEAETNMIKAYSPKYNSPDSAMTHSQLGVKGGASRSEKKVATSRANAAKARASRMSKADVGALSKLLRAGDIIGAAKILEGKSGAK